MRLWLGLIVLVGGCVFDRGGLTAQKADGPAPFDLSRQDGPASEGPSSDGMQLADSAPFDAKALDTKAPTPDARPDTTPPTDALPWPDQTGPLFFDDFSNATTLVPDGKAIWTQQNGVYQQTACAVTHSAIPGAGWKDVAVSVKLRPDGTCSGYYNQVGLSIRVEGNGACSQWDYYACVIDVDGDYLFMCHLDHSCGCTIWSKKNTGNIKTGQWYSLKFSAVGQALTCELSGGGLTPVSVTRNDGANTSGSAGLVTAGVKVSFDDLKVEPAP